MPNDGAKQRKGKAAPAVNNEETKNTHKPCEEEEIKRNELDAKPNTSNSSVSTKTSWCCAMDVRSIVSLLSVGACVLLVWVVHQQNEKLNNIEEKYSHLYGKASDLMELEKKFIAFSEKLEVSEDHLKDAQSFESKLKKLRHDVSSLNSIITTMNEDQDASSLGLQSVNEHFLNVTETWQDGLSVITKDLTTLRSESHMIHSRVTEQVNKAEDRLRTLSQRLEELEDSTKRNGRVLERTEDEDAKNIQNQLDWNTKQVARLQEQLRLLFGKDSEFEEKLIETEPQAKQCTAQLPTVEEAVRSILRLGADLSGVERKLEELTLQVFGTEDSMFKALTEILALRQTLDEMQVDSNRMKVKNELRMVLDVVKELTSVQSETEVATEPNNDINT